MRSWNPAEFRRFWEGSEDELSSKGVDSSGIVSEAGVTWRCNYCKKAVKKKEKGRKRRKD